MLKIFGYFKRRGNIVSDAVFLRSDLEDEANNQIENSAGPVLFAHSGITAPHPQEDRSISLNGFRGACVLDGRIDCRPELFEQLGTSMRDGQQLSDREMVMRSWRKWGTACPEYLYGDFAFAIWDESKKILFCARDHIGVRPFYFSLNSDRFVFASDIERLINTTGVSDRIDEGFLAARLSSTRHELKDRTAFRDVRRLLPGHSMIVKTADERLRRYWRPENLPAVKFRNDDDYADAALDLLSRAVDDRLAHSKQPGVHLSGGLDSSSIAVLANRSSKRTGAKPVEYFSWQMPPDESGISRQENTAIEAIIVQENLKINYTPSREADVIRCLRNDSAIIPFNNTIINESVVQAKACELGVDVMLSGWGGDESLSFNGRGYFGELLTQGKWLTLLKNSREAGEGYRGFVRRLFYTAFAYRRFAVNAWHGGKLETGPGYATYISPELLSRKDLSPSLSRRLSVRSTMFWLWNSGLLNERMESWAAYGNRAGIVYAYPMLDRRVLEFVAGLPAEQFIRRNKKRVIIRNAMRNLLPAVLLEEGSKGEPVRVQNALTAAYSAMETIEKELQVRPRESSREKYLDMDRLLHVLQPEILSRKPKPAPILQALSFLDF